MFFDKYWMNFMSCKRTIIYWDIVFIIKSVSNRMKLISKIFFIPSFFFSSFITKINFPIINLNKNSTLFSFNASPSLFCNIPVTNDLNWFNVLLFNCNSFCSWTFFSLSVLSLSTSGFFFDLKCPKNPPLAVFISLSNFPISIILLIISFPISLRVFILSNFKFFSSFSMFSEYFLFSLAFLYISIYFVL